MNVLVALIWLNSLITPVPAPQTEAQQSVQEVAAREGSAQNISRPKTAESGPVEANPPPPPNDEGFEVDSEDPAPKPPSAAALATLSMIDAALKRIKPDVQREGNIWRVELGERMALVITDPSAERMRIMVPIAEAEPLEEAVLRRMMQANFDSALDARYAIAQGVVWGVYIHPLTSLNEKDFLSGFAQALKVAENFGTTYSSDVFVYGGGDSNGIYDDLLERLKTLEEGAEKDTI